MSCEYLRQRKNDGRFYCWWYGKCPHLEDKTYQCIIIENARKVEGYK